MSRTHSPSGRAYLTYDPEELHDRLWNGFDGGTGWDIGANEGQSVARMVQQFDRVVALEPAAESFAKLQADWDGDARVTLVNAAAGAMEGELETSVRWTPMGSGQLCAQEIPEDGWHGPHLYTRRVPCVTLDSLLDGYGWPDFVKIDTEGFEEQILRGAEQVRVIGPDWLIEYHSPDLFQACYDLLDSAYLMEEVVNPESPGNGWILARRS